MITFTVIFADKVSQSKIEGDLRLDQESFFNTLRVRLKALC